MTEVADVRRVLVTGATRGLGAALVRGFSGAGWAVAGFGRDEGAVASLASETGAYLRTADLADGGSLDRFFGECFDEWGLPFLLVNNAGVINRNAPLWEVPEDEFALVLDVNVSGIHRVLRRAVPAMIDRGTGIVVNLSSGWGRSTSPEVGPYCASKWAVEGLSRSLSQELPPGMACVSLNPGVINTAMLQSCFGKEGASQSPDLETWAKRAVPFLAGLRPDQNGEALTVPS